MIQVDEFYKWISVKEDNSVFMFTTEPPNIQMGHIWWLWKDETLQFTPIIYMHS